MVNMLLLTEKKLDVFAFTKKVGHLTFKADDEDLKISVRNTV